MGHDNVSTPMLEGQEDKIKELKEYYGLVFLERVASVASVANGQPDVVTELFEGL